MRLLMLTVLSATLYALAACGQTGPLTLPPAEDTRVLTVLAR
ncbi:MAG: lipoprotein [Pseudomonadales bacterium]